MASVTFPVALGGDGSTVTDDASPTTGLANGGHRTRFVPSLSQLVVCANGGVTQSTAQVALAAAQVALATTQAGNALTSANNAATSASNAATSAATALTAPGTTATSTTSLTVNTGAQALTIQTGKSFIVGQWVAISDTSLVGRWMMGQITAYTSGTGALTVSVTQTNGSGTSATWAVAPAPAVPAIVATTYAGVYLGSLF